MGAPPSARDDLVRRRQIRRVRDPDQHHLGCRQRVRRFAGFLEPLEQHLPEARQQRHGEAIPERARAALFVERELFAGRFRSDGLDARRDVRRFRQIGQNLGSVRAVVMQTVERLKRRPDVARDELFEQIEDAAAVGKPEHRAHIRRR